MTHEIVVASYLENIMWVDFWKAGNDAVNILPDSKITVYRAGQNVENRGREAGQWLHHIVKNYDKLADFTFFVQADLGPAYGKTCELWPLDMNYLRSFKPIPHSGFFIWPSLIPIEKAGPANTRGNSYPETDVENIGFLWGSAPEEISWADIFPMAFVGAQHVVSKDIIHALPKTYYEGILGIITDRFAWWLEYGKWPAIIYDLFKQGPLSEKGSTHQWVTMPKGCESMDNLYGKSEISSALMPVGEAGDVILARGKLTEAERREAIKVGSHVE
jgi:hypothetical protein